MCSDEEREVISPDHLTVVGADCQSSSGENTEE